MDSKDHSTSNQTQQFDWIYSDSYQRLIVIYIFMLPSKY